MVPLERVQEATHALVRTVDAMSDDAYAAPSLLPGWGRAHVVAHLALNAEALAFCLRGLADGQLVPMYLTPDARDAEIDDLSGAAPGELRHRLLGATTAFARAVRAMPEAAWGGDIERTPGHVLMPAERVPLARLREVEIHHADLGLTYGPADWPAEHAELILDHEVAAHSGAFRLHARDLDRTWQVGEGGGPTVAGDASALAWWLSGRPVEELSCDGGELPEVTTP